MSKGLLIIISGPSGSGKSTIRNHLLEMSDEFYYSVSATTRPIKDNEIDGVDYHFITHDEFNQRIENDDFLEYKPYSVNMYGTIKSKVTEQLEAGKNVILDIEVKGALELMDKYPDIISIWLLPPNYTALRNRLYDRKRDTPEEIERRLDIAKEEIKHFYTYDYIVVNDDGQPDKAAREIMNIIECEKLKTSRNQKFYENFNKQNQGEYYDLSPN